VRDAADNVWKIDKLESLLKKYLKEKKKRLISAPKRTIFKRI
jgi:hypothetical protein